ncbi:hypothetical protein HID58_024526 [Brassica napus]|uniref:Uncharacterized protein n=1 Tax=Brassica napus TaxID=3708 RepID=A0ABQ7XIS2_BRANA|nr:hypothetical protein HID58_024526 [Brassica napus]
MAPETEATPAFPISVLVKSRLSLMMGTRGAAANVEIKQVKKEIHPKWKALMCGFANDNGLNTFALCSESTGKGNIAVGSSDWTLWEDHASSPWSEKEKTCSFAVTPCMEVPIDPSSSLR